MKLRKLLALVAVAMLALVPLSECQADGATLDSAPATVALSYVIGESVTVTATPTATFTGTTPTTGTITVTTTWQLAATRTKINTNLYFASATAALTDGAGDNIPVANVFANKDGGSYSACNTNPGTGMPGVTGASCNVGQGVTLTTNFASSQTDTFTLQLQGLSASLPAGSYTGTLTVEAGVQ